VSLCRIPTSRLDYEQIKFALKHRFGITQSSYRKRFLTAKIMPHEMQSEFIKRLNKLFMDWLASAGFESTFEGVMQHLLNDRYLASHEKDLKVYLKEKGKLDLNEITKYAQNYLDAREVEIRHLERGQFDQNKKKFEFKQKTESKLCNTVEKSHNFQAEKVKNGDYQKGKSTLTCFNCGLTGHKSYNCSSNRTQSNGGNKVVKKAAACQIIKPVESNTLSNVDSVSKDMRKTSWPIVAVVGGSDEMIYLSDLKYPLRGKAKAAGKTVEFLRDTGSSVSILKSSFLKPENYTGKTTTV
jgi:hypothetical protein